MIRSPNLAISVLLVLLSILLLSCVKNPTEPELTEENVARIIAEEFAKMADAAGVA